MELVVAICVFSVALIWVASRADKHSGAKMQPRQDNDKQEYIPYDAQSATGADPGREITGPAWVIDGDSIVIARTQIRLFGVDAPEIGHPYGQKAKWKLVELCKGHQIRAQILSEDAHGRTVAKCALPDGRDLSAEMVLAGLAIDWPKFSGGAYRAMEVAGIRKKLWLADARQKGRMHLWAQYDARRKERAAKAP